MIVRRAAVGDEPILRALRLLALSEAPAAFGSTYDRELARTPADWQRWLSPGATFLVDAADGVRGLVAGMPDATDPAIVHLMAMWVHPALRGSGAADALVAAVLSWARESRARVVRLAVVQANDRARRCYERNGFRATGTQSVRDRDGAIEIEMDQALSKLATPGD
jgi:ribosomal protein S18 acetylase RimI-like enzyme